MYEEQELTMQVFSEPEILPMEAEIVVSQAIHLQKIPLIEAFERNKKK